MTISNDLAQAQAKLLRLRAQLGNSNRSRGEPSPPPTQRGQKANYLLINAQGLLKTYRDRDGVEYRAAMQHRDAPNIDELLHDFSIAKEESEPAGKKQQEEVTSKSVTHHPSLGLAVCRLQQTTSYRVWLIARYLDPEGKGWVDVQRLKEEWPFSWRRLRQVLNEGQDVFWRWNKEQERLWLFGVVRVADKLQVYRLEGRPISLPASILFGNIAAFRAHLYAAWHSGRKQRPISRSKQREITGIPERTQRHYCQVAGIKRQRNIALGRSYNQKTAQEAAWEHGRGMFKFVDRQGRLGRPGKSYIAYHMPSTHFGPHCQTAKGRQRKINRKLKDLVDRRAQGNSSKTVNRLYHTDGKAAVEAYNRSPHLDAYWPLSTHESNELELWSVIMSKETMA